MRIKQVIIASSALALALVVWLVQRACAQGTATVPALPAIPWTNILQIATPVGSAVGLYYKLREWILTTRAEAAQHVQQAAAAALLKAEQVAADALLKAEAVRAEALAKAEEVRALADKEIAIINSKMKTHCSQGETHNYEMVPCCEEHRAECGKLRAAETVGLKETVQRLEVTVGKAEDAVRRMESRRIPGVDDGG